jgi:hypothetical protein
MLSYEKLESAVKKCPMTWTAALFLTLLQRVIELGVFNDVKDVVAKAEERILKENSEAVERPLTGNNIPPSAPPQGEITPDCVTCERFDDRAYCDNCNSGSNYK